jgi:hypothetical protein
VPGIRALHEAAAVAAIDISPFDSGPDAAPTDLRTRQRHRSLKEGI